MLIVKSTEHTGKNIKARERILTFTVKDIDSSKLHA